MREENVKAAERAQQLYEAEKGRKPITVFSTDPQFNAELAREVQFASKSAALRRGEKLTGYKIGLTSAEAQKQFNVFQPDFGHLFASMQVPNGGVLKRSSLIQARVEGEIAFLLRQDLKGPGLTIADVAQAIAGAVAAIEIVDCRYESWKALKSIDLIADNGASSRYVLGDKVVPLEKGLDLPLVGMSFAVNGEVVLTGAGAACLENPLEAVKLLANELGAMGETLLAGQIILSGALSAMVPLQVGETYEAEFWRLGKVCFRCEE